RPDAEDLSGASRSADVDFSAGAALRAARAIPWKTPQESTRTPDTADDCLACASDPGGAAGQGLGRARFVRRADFSASNLERPRGTGLVGCLRCGWPHVSDRQ